MMIMISWLQVYFRFSLCRNGDKYAGEYFADKTHGFGVYCFGNGHCYEGAWHEGRRQGLGMYTFRNGDTQSGHWQNGVLNVPSTQDNLPETSLAISHSKVLIAVQVILFLALMIKGYLGPFLPLTDPTAFEPSLK